jgi:hypothetical protein
VHLNDAPRDSLIAVSDNDVLDLELIRRRLIGRHRDIRLLAYRHDPTLPVSAPSLGGAPVRQERNSQLGSGYLRANVATAGTEAGRGSRWRRVASSPEMAHEQP